VTILFTFVIRNLASFKNKSSPIRAGNLLCLNRVMKKGSLVGEAPENG
jgi:hypothetical protein